MCFWSCDSTSIPEAKTQIQRYLDVNYSNEFVIDSIVKNYSKDLFHQQTGFKVWLVDSEHIRFGPIFFQRNTLRKWITYMGSDIEKEYQTAQKTNSR